jgi:pimeloyl-ACP methyl ester carboxylesterase
LRAIRAPEALLAIASPTSYDALVAVRVEYVTTSDGIRIAYATRGRGPAIVSMSPLPCRHIELEWEEPDERRWLESLGRGRTLVQYDPRGFGLSERDATTSSLDASDRDLDAVLERVAPGGATLFAAVSAGPLAIAYAAHHPDRVSNLILWCSSSRGMEGLGPQLDALLGLVEQNWELATETAAHVLRGWSAGQSARRLATMLRACATPSAVRAFAGLARQLDVTPLLAEVRSPTLVLHRRRLTWIPSERAIELAARIPGALLVLLDGDSMAPWAGDAAAAARAIDEFLGAAPEEDPEEAPAGAPHTFRCHGEYWTLSFAGRLCRVRDAKGLHHIAYLLARPGEHVPVAELLDALDGRARCDGAGTTPLALSDAGPRLDVRAKAAYRRRLHDLRAELADAECSHDTGREGAARAEIEFIEREIASSIGLGGRDRPAASAAERARLTVTKRIKDAVTRVGRQHSALGEHLAQTVRTGFLCAYTPGPELPGRWVV